MQRAYTNRRSRTRRLSSGFGLTACLLARAALAESAQPEFVVHPLGPTTGHWTVGLGLGVDVLPRRLVESEWRQLPHAWWRSRVGLGRHFYAAQRASVVVIDNQIQLGLGWGHAIGDFAWGLHDYFGVTWGTIGVSGFDATGWALAHNPGFSIAYPLRGVYTTLTAEALILHSRHITVGEASITQKHITFQGASFGLTFESPLESKDVIFYGLAVIYAKPDYQLWLAFSDIETRQIYPRFFVGYAF